MKVEVNGKTKDRVEYLLKTEPHLREDDNKLIANMWFADLGGRKSVPLLTGELVLKAIADGKVTSPESIMRARRKIQEDNKELRGKNYNKRKGNQEEIKNQLNH